MRLEEYKERERTADASIGAFRHFEGNAYKVTGATTDGKRFTLTYRDPRMFFGINLWHGSKWIKYADEERWRLIGRVG